MSAIAWRDVLVRADWRILSHRTERIQDLPGAETSRQEATNDEQP